MVSGLTPCLVEIGELVFSFLTSFRASSCGPANHYCFADAEGNGCCGALDEVVSRLEAGVYDVRSGPHLCLTECVRS